MARAIFLPALIVFCSLSFMPTASAEIGRASWYGMTTRTASGERCNPNDLTAAHRTLPFDTKVEVENLANGRMVVVRINDRGPFSRGRIIDVTRAAASQLGFLAEGSAKVRLKIIAKE